MWWGCNLSVTVKISYNSSIWRVWVNGKTHDRVEDRVILEFKEMLNKCQPVNLKIKNENKCWHGVDVT